MNRTFFLLYLIIILLFGCKKEKSPPYYKISNEFRNWVDFQEGSYWIYKNDISGLTDSVYCKNRYSTTIIRQGSPYYYDVINIDFSANNLVQWSFISVNPDFEGVNMDGLGYSLRSNTNLGQNIIWDNEIYQYSNHYDSLLIIDNIFFNVIHTHIVKEHNIEHDSIIGDFYFSKFIGLIKYKKKLQNDGIDTTWSLIKWKIIQ